MAATTRSTALLARSSARRTRPAAAAAALLLLGVVILGAPSTATAADVIIEPIASGTTDEVAYTIERHIGEPAFDLGTDSGQSYSVRVENLSDADVRVGLSVDIRQQGVVEDLWASDFLDSAIGPEQLADNPTFISDYFSPVIGVGGTYEILVPDWPGLTYVFQQLEPTAQVLASVMSDGLYVSFFDPTVPEGGINSATVSGNELFPGLTATVTASGLPAGRELGVWMAPGVNYFEFLFSGGVLDADAFEAGSAVVAADGSYSATVSVPLGTAIGSYQLVVGDPATRSWPAGTNDPFQISTPSTTASTATAAGTDVQTSLAVSGSTVGLTFAGVDTAGETTVTSSGTGPLLAGFQFATDPAEYLHIDTTAGFSGDVVVCIAFDPARVPVTPRLYHFADGAWVDITTLREPGRVCGVTDSFSPFVLGIPNGVELANKQQCKDGGWRTSTLPPFANQGACVSWFQARGR